MRLLITSSRVSNPFTRLSMSGPTVWQAISIKIEFGRTSQTYVRKMRCKSEIGTYVYVRNDEAPPIFAESTRAYLLLSIHDGT